MPSIINATTSTGLVSSADNSGSLQLATNNGTTAVTIDTSQNVGIGTSSITNYSNYVNLSIGGGASAGGIIQFQTTAGTDGAHIRADRSGATLSSLIIETRSGTNAPLIFGTNATERMRINAGAPILCLSGGNTTATGTGIAFPATQSASSDANTLDDYEEGSWTPVITGLTTAPVGVTYSGQHGRYVKIGSVVHVFCDLTLNNVGTTGAGRVAITGIPFTSDSNSIFSPCASETEALLTAITTQLVPLVPPVTSRVEFYAGWNGTGGPSSVDYATHMKAGTILRFYVCFRST
jgi:hypothetical protein